MRRSGVRFISPAPKHQGQQVKVCWPFFVFCDRIITETFSQIRTMTMPKPIRPFFALLLLAFGLGSAMAQRMYDSSGRQLGRVDAERFYSASGHQIGRVDGEQIYDASGRQLGRIDGDRVYDASGRQLGRIDGERLYSASGSLMGRLDGERIYDASGRQIGRADGLRRMQMIVYFYFFM
jgi:hypothetical protein